MNPLQKGYAPQKIVQVKKALSWKPYTLQLVGTGGLKAQQTYAADYDFVSKIEKWDKDSCYDSIQQILDNINTTPDLFFVELKLQNKDGSKIKIHKTEDFNKESFYVAFDPDAIDYAKIDGVVDLNGSFKEVSALYFLSSTPLDNAKYQAELLKDAEEKYKDGKPYKALKRMFMAEKLQGRLGRAVDMTLIRHITDFFNSEVGKLYERMNQIDAALIFHDKYSGPMDMRRLDRFITNIGLSGINVLQLPQVSKDYNKIIQREALKFFKQHKLTPGKLPGGVGLAGGFGFDITTQLLKGIPSLFGEAKSGITSGVKSVLNDIGDDKLRSVGLDMANNVIKKIQKSQKRADKAKAAPTGGNILSTFKRRRGGAAADESGSGGAAWYDHTQFKPAKIKYTTY